MRGQDQVFWKWLDSSKWFLLVCVALALCSWIFRYEVSTISYGTSSTHLPVAFVLDRWTGNITLTTGSSTPAHRRKAHEPATEREWEEVPSASPGEK